jgi:2-C-methyl-D-erythritol 2,4-cyclodiphosphate synthase
VSVSTSGIGWDSHRFETGRRLVLGGVEIPHDQGLAGHSDADVVTHAVIDAVLGAAGLGDIGDHFPDTDERWRDADSLELLGSVVAQARAAGYGVVHVDVTVILEAPKLAPHRDDMRARLAGVLGVALGHVNVKATTAEGMGLVGSGQGAAAVAVSTLERG